MKLQQRIFLLSRLGKYILSDDEEWKQVKERASRENRWFIPEFIDIAANNIANSFLQKDILENWIHDYGPDSIFPSNPLSIGLVMAGNIPLVGFHDLLCIFISGHSALVKLSSKDQVLIKHLIGKLEEWTIGNPEESEMKESILHI